MDEKSINRRDIIKSIGGVGIVCSTFSTRTLASRSGAPVKKRAARDTARQFVDYVQRRNEFEDWRRQGVKKPELFYSKVVAEDSNETEYVPSAWVFPVEYRGEDVGYLTISARNNDPSVLVYGRAKAPQRRLDSAKRVANASGRSVHKRFLYHGGTEFGIETQDENMVDLRGERIKPVSPVRQNTFTVSGSQGDPVDWSGGTDDEVDGDVPNWTGEDKGGASSTDFGSGPDSWSSIDKGWDGCSPIAASMVLGFYEGLDRYNDWSEVEALIDHLHESMDTDDAGNTNPLEIDNGIENYDEGQYSYNAANKHFNKAGVIKDEIAESNPAILSMASGPYTKDEEGIKNGHSVCVVGYRQESCGILCNNVYFKVHNGYAESPDRVVDGAWDRAVVTKVSVE